MRYRWVLPVEDSTSAGPGVGPRGPDSILRSCLRHRGLEAMSGVDRFLDPRLQHLTDPLEFSDMSAMVERLQQARAARECVLLFGDYDVDGLTATAVLRSTMEALGWRSVCHVPDRFADGYGLNGESVRQLVARHGVDVVLAIDCGTSSGELIAELAGEGIEVLVLDHHQPGDGGLPGTLCLHPQTLPSEQHPAARLCSAGLAFKLAHALVKEGRRQGLAGEEAFDVRELLDLAALGTVADLVPLVGENRILVASGLARLVRGARPGLQALMEVAGLRQPVRASALAFQLGPRLNAAGRLETPRRALELLLTRDVDEARELAEWLDRKNRERQTLERGISTSVMERIQGRFDPARDWVLVEGEPSWHLGVVGIVAARVVRAFHRPAIILGGDGAVLRGSGRSIPGFDLAAALSQAEDLVSGGGGHSMAVGVSVLPERLGDFRERLNRLARDGLQLEQLMPELRLDGVLSLDRVTLEVVRLLARLEPTGQGNSPACFLFPNLRLCRSPQRFGQEGRHLRWRVTNGEAVADAVWWGGMEMAQPEGLFDLAAYPEANEFGGRVSVRLRVADWRPAQGS